MKGYVIEAGYMGYVDGEYQFFACEADYKEWMEEQERRRWDYLKECLILIGTER